MNRSGPSLEVLTRRLLETPPDFLAEPALGNGGGVAVPALVNDLLHMFGERAPIASLKAFEGGAPQADRNRLALVMIATWLLADEWFRGASLRQGALLALLGEQMAALAATAPAHRFVGDADRREELARVVLACLDYRPQGETPEQASDRLAAISGAARRGLLAASRASEQRARAIREALAKKAAEESADKWTRE